MTGMDRRKRLGCLIRQRFTLAMKVQSVICVNSCNRRGRRLDREQVVAVADGRHDLLLSATGGDHRMPGGQR